VRHLRWLALALIAAGIGLVITCARRPAREPRAPAPWDASATLALPGLRAPARVVTDRWGIPHLRCESLHDLYFVWGFVSARDRLWQLEYTRRAARGELSDWLGNRSLRDDGGAQLFDFRARAEAIWERERGDPAVREALERYAAGIDAWVARCRAGAEAWPAELARLKREPEPWRPEDAILIELALGALLDLALPELEEERTARERGAGFLESHRRFESAFTMSTIPDSAATRLYGRAPRPTLPGRPFPAGTRSGSRPSEGEADPLAAAQQALGGWLSPATFDPSLRASNIFAVGPARSGSGRPVLANDPHLRLTAPGALHVIHLDVPGVVDAIGAYAPGLPAIVSGRNRDVAWGITALSADVIDVYADSLSEDGRSVLWQGRWEPIREEPFRMRYRAVGLKLPVFGQTRRYAPRGPIVSLDRKRRRAYSVRWTALERMPAFGRQLGLERSRSAAEVVERYASLVTPTLNVVAADAGGDVRYRAVGLLPRRGFEAPLGAVPGDGRHEWLGVVATDSMPAWSPPAGGFVVNANNLPVGSPYPEPLPRFDWPHDRAARMAQRLAGDTRVTLADAASVQNDVVSRGAERFVPRLLRCADSLAGSLDPRQRAALDTLRRWDFVVRRDRVAPTLYRGWFGAFARRSKLEGLPGLMAAALDGRDGASLPAPEGRGQERPATAAVAALALALDELEQRLGPDLATWRWGRAHWARFQHPLVHLDSTLAPRPVPTDGDNATPCVGRSHLPWSRTFEHGAVWRHVVDLAVADSSLGVVPPGNAADGPHARDHLERWANHRYVPLHLDWKRIEAARESELRLTPTSPAP